MTQELEVAAAASIGSWLRRRKHRAAPPGSACMNCGATLEGPFCHQCGQLAEDYHRSLWRLFEEVFEGLADKDGRFWRTLPRLALKPGTLTREYLDGKRASQIPPLRMFLVVLLLVFFVGGLPGAGPRKATVVQASNGRTVVKQVTTEDLRKGLGDDVQVDLGKRKGAKETSIWLKTRIKAAANNPRQFQMILQEWAHRLAVLMLPLGAALLALLFVFQRRFYIYDHLVFTMHSLSFQGLLLSTAFLIRLIPGFNADILFFAAPVHLFVHMRGVYRTDILGTLLRMLLLGIGSTIGVGCLVAAILLIGLSSMNPA
jgi:hypothetical protein